MENFVKVIIESKLNVNLCVLDIKPLLFKDFRKINNKKKLKKKINDGMQCLKKRNR